MDCHSPSPLSEARIRSVAAFLSRWRRALRHVGYEEAEDLAAILAGELCAGLGRPFLESAEFRAVPRGGLIVLGMVAYHLGLAREAMRPHASGPLVLVDDCSLSGLRLRQEMVTVADGRPVVVAHLFSAPELRQAVLATEPRVRACFSARDLEDLSRQLFPDPETRAEWHRRSEERMEGDRRYWTGLPEPVSFAWSEPDRPFWNPAAGRIEDGWRFVAPHHCLKSAARLASGLPEIKAHAEQGAKWQSPPCVTWGDFDDRVWLVRDADEEVFSLEGPAALAWKALVVGRDEEGAAAALAAVFDVSPERARLDVVALRDDLVRERLLEPADGG